MKQYTCSEGVTTCNRCNTKFPKDTTVSWELKFDQLFCQECPEYKEFEQKKHHT